MLRREEDFKVQLAKLEKGMYHNNRHIYITIIGTIILHIYTNDAYTYKHTSD
jgi:hypothetical protein